jgi:hypothetical protein
MPTDDRCITFRNIVNYAYVLYWKLAAYGLCCCAFFSRFLTADSVFSAIEVALRRSSIVAVKVGIVVAHRILVETVLLRLFVFTNSPVGTLRLSGATAFATASASFSVQ